MNLEQLIPTKNFTYSFEYGDMKGTPFYAMGYSKATELKTHTRWKLSELKNIVKKYVKDHPELSEMCLGMWSTNDFIYLDCVLLVSKELPLFYVKMMAEERGQIAIYDLENDECHDTSYKN